MKKTLLLLTLLVSFVIVPTSILSCSNSSNGPSAGTSDIPSNNPSDNSSNNSQSFKDFQTSLEKLGTFKAVGTIPTPKSRLYELTSLNENFINKIPNKDPNCGISNSYKTEDGNLIECNHSEYNYIEVTGFTENYASFIVFKRNGKVVEPSWNGIPINLSSEEIANLTNTPLSQITSLEDVFKCINKLGQVTRYGNACPIEAYLYQYDSFNNKVKNYLSNKSTNCGLWKDEYQTADGKDLKFDNTQNYYVEVTYINKNSKTANIRFFNKTDTGNAYYRGIELNFTWEELANLAN